MTLEKQCSVCDSYDKVDIETVTNVAPCREDMFPVLMCWQCKALLASGKLDIRLDDSGNLSFITRKKNR